MHGKLMISIKDAATNQPAGGLRCQVFWVETTGDVLLRTATTTATGTTSKPMIDSAQFSAGIYRLVLHVGDYFAGQSGPEATRFFDLLPITFVVADASADVILQILISHSSYTVNRV